ncbi:MAG: hypothetical protein KAR06_01100 [Deltaproteobacteria bacterium]|nr:hypothetical protein [Deltaproteobacteria bacterium]
MKMILILFGVWAVPGFVFTCWWFKGRISDEGSLIDIVHALIVLVWTIAILCVGLGFWFASW